MKITKYFSIITLALAFSSCTNVVDSYTVDGSGRDWISDPIQKLPASKVTPNVKVPLPNGGSAIVPIIIEPSK